MTAEPIATTPAGGEAVPAQAQAKPLLEVENLVVEHRVHGATVHAVSGVSFAIAAGETLGLVGESGCGKSTLARALLQLCEIRCGRVVVDGTDLVGLRGEALRQMRRRIQMVFQDPVASLNPRRRVGEIVAEPLVIAGVGERSERHRRVRDAMEAVGLDPQEVGGRLPHEFSGGQCQRVNIARALVLEPALLICDEPVSSLDVSIRAQILNLLEEMKARFGLTMLFIAHDLAAVRAVSDRIAVMYLGKLCELGDSVSLFRAPLHPYTAMLVASVPVPDPSADLPPNPRAGEPPSPLNPPAGCRFRTRCPRASALCSEREPPMRERTPGRSVACHHPLDATIGAEPVPDRP